MTGQLTPEFLTDLESRMKVISSNEYTRLQRRQWWNLVAKERPLTGKRERLIWLLDTARIDYVNRLGGEVTFEEILSNTMEIEGKAATGGLQLNRVQLDDHDGGGVELAAHWAKGVGAMAAYWPQKQVAKALLANGLAYDGQNFFDTDHPVNPFETAFGNYANDLTGSASGVYPGACPIDPTNAATLDIAFANLAKAINYVEGALLMPNGEDPRNLKVAAVMGPTALRGRLQQLTNAKFIAQSAGSNAGGTGDVEAIVRDWGIGQPVIAPELGAKFTGGSDTTYYLICEEAGSDEMGALIYGNKEPFQVIYNDQMSDAELARANQLQWLIRGQNVVAYGHPFLVFRVQAT